MMQPSVLKIRLYGDPCLRKNSSIVKDLGSSEQLLIKSMLATMYEAKGVGLAAPQVGINQRIFVADIGDGPMVFINPQVVKKSGSGRLEEGCLSVPGVNVPVKRAQKILVRFVNEDNQKKEKHFEGLFARVIQHETDHLNGKLIVDYANFSLRQKIKKILKEIREFQKTNGAYRPG
jgi:peptide deformylase